MLSCAHMAHGSRLWQCGKSSIAGRAGLRVSLSIAVNPLMQSTSWLQSTQGEAVQTEPTRPALDIRIRGFRVTMQDIPVKFLTLLSASACSGFTAWITSR